MFCKICFDAKKPESVYTSHRIREGFGKDRKVTCPILLQVRCHSCNEVGHTTSYCKKSSYKKFNNRRQKEDYRHSPPCHGPIDPSKPVLRIELPTSCKRTGNTNHHTHSIYTLDMNISTQNQYGILEIEQNNTPYSSPVKTATQSQYPPLSYADKARNMYDAPSAPKKIKSNH